MSIYSPELQALMDQLCSQVEDLQVAVSGGNHSTMVDATAAVAQTASAIDQNIKATDIPPEDTAILWHSGVLLDEVSQLQTLLGTTGYDPEAVPPLSDAVYLTTQNMDFIVDKMAQTQPYAEPPLLPFWPT